MYCSELLSSAETLVYRDDNIEEYDRLVIDNRRRQVIVGARFTYLLTYLLLPVNETQTQGRIENF